MTRFILAAVLALSTIAPSLAQDVPPAEKNEIPARTCYAQAMEYWNAVIANAPRDLKRLNQSYKNFATCAKVAIDTGEKLPSGARLVWGPEYFASTIGALYAQRKLAEVDKIGKCSHLQLVGELAEQAEETASEHAGAGPYAVESFLDDWSQYVAKVKQQALDCGVNLKTV
jgi:hypothetical protein